MSMNAVGLIGDGQKAKTYCFYAETLFFLKKNAK